MRFEEAFEQAVPELVAAAWDYADRSNAIDLIWIYLSKDGHWAFYHPTFKAGGKVLDTVELKQILPDLDTSYEAQKWMLGRLDEASNGIIRAMDNPDDFPRRIIIKFRPSDQDLTADFYHGNLPDEEEIPDHRLADQWFDRLKTTGNDSAQP